MKRILIVEDEILARIGLHQLIDWENMGFEFLPDARDGKEALETLRKERPDIVLLDLNIPEIDGLQLLRYMKEEHMPCKTIVISCNEEFDMIKSAMKLGAFDYLRKLNLSPDELQDILRKCLESEEHRTPELFDIRYEEIISQAGRNIFADDTEYKMIICILSQTADKVSAYEATNYIKRFFHERGLSFRQILKSTPGGYYYIFPQECDKKITKYLVDELKLRFDSDWYIGTCRKSICNEVSLNEAMILAEQIFVYSYYDDSQNIQEFSEKILLGQHSPGRCQQKIVELKEAIASFQPEDTVRCIKDIFASIKAESYTHINVLRRIFMDMLGIYSMTAQSLGGAIEEIEILEDNCHYQKLVTMNSLNQIEHWFLIFAQEFYKKYVFAHTLAGSELLSDAVDYIDDHLYQKILLSEAAEKIGVSSAYLSSYFKKETGINFIEFVNMRKIDRSLEMIKDGQMVGEVSEKLGFENSTYFSRVFKKYRGVSPDIYKKSLQ